MKRFSILSIGLLIVIGLLLVGCGGDSSSTNSKVTLTLWNRISPELFTKATKGFEKKYPNIMVKVQQLPQSTQSKAQYQAAVSNNSLPDLFVGEKYTLSQFVNLKQVHKLDEVFTSKVKIKYLPTAWYEGNTTLNGHVYKMPIYSSSGTYMLFYNKKILKKYNLQVPKTWDQLIAAGQKVYKKSNGKVYGLMMGAQSNYVGTGGAEVIARTISPATGMNYKTGKFNFATKGMLQTFHFFEKMKHNKVLAPESLTLSDIKAIPIFTTGRAAFLLSGNWAGGIMKAKSNFKGFGVTSLPTKNLDAREPFNYVTGGGQGLYVAKYTKHWPQVKLYLKYLTKHVYAEVVKEGRQVPAKRMSNIKANVKSETPEYQNITKLMLKESIPQPNPIALNKAAWKVNSKYNSLKPLDLVGDVLRGYLSGQIKNPKAALQKLSKQNNQAFQKALQSVNKVSIKDFQFSNWVPGEPYTKKQLKELEPK